MRRASFPVSVRSSRRPLRAINRVNFTVDLRHHRDEAIEAMEQQVRARPNGRCGGPLNPLATTDRYKPMRSFFHPGQSLHHPRSCYSRGQMRTPQEVPERAQRLVQASRSLGFTVEQPTASLVGEPAAYALCRPPGHHARAEAASGFCYVNNATVLRAAIRRRGPHRHPSIKPQAPDNPNPPPGTSNNS